MPADAVDGGGATTEEISAVEPGQSLLPNGTVQVEKVEVGGEPQTSIEGLTVSPEATETVNSDDVADEGLQDEAATP